MEYQPHPIDLAQVTLSPSLTNDLERIAQNIHEVWAQERKMRGWEYGRLYDEKKKTHPCLIAYGDLPELEKDMDRATVTQTIKMLLWMGYSIEKNGGIQNDL